MHLKIIQEYIYKKSEIQNLNNAFSLINDTWIFEFNLQIFEISASE